MVLSNSAAHESTLLKTGCISKSYLCFLTCSSETSSKLAILTSEKPFFLNDKSFDLSKSDNSNPERVFSYSTSSFIWCKNHLSILQESKTSSNDQLRLNASATYQSLFSPGVDSSNLRAPFPSLSFNTDERPNKPFSIDLIAF